MEGENKSSLLLNFLFFREIILVGLIFFFLFSISSLEKEWMS